jgi:hypothetical protein
VLVVVAYFSPSLRKELGLLDYQDESLCFYDLSEQCTGTKKLRKKYFFYVT